MCYRHDGDGKCEEFEKKTSIKDCGFFTPEGFEDQWAVNVTVNPHYRRRKCSENIIVQPGPPSRDLVSRHKNIKICATIMWKSVSKPATNESESMNENGWMDGWMDVGRKEGRKKGMNE